jgi:hypothetical protein
MPRCECIMGCCPVCLKNTKIDTSVIIKPKKWESISYNNDNKKSQTNSGIYIIERGSGGYIKNLMLTPY